MEPKTKIKTKFSLWIIEFGGDKKLAAAMKVDEKAIWRWRHRRNIPTLRNITKMIKLSGGYLTPADFFPGAK